MQLRSVILWSALLGFIAGVRVSRPKGESVGHQLVRLFTDPKAKRKRTALRRRAKARARRASARFAHQIAK